MGSPAEAIALYDRAIQAAGSDRELEAAALLRKAGCYEKLGRTENARTLYAEIANRFAGAVAGSARMKLAALRPAAGVQASGAGPFPSQSIESYLQGIASSPQFTADGKLAVYTRDAAGLDGATHGLFGGLSVPEPSSGFMGLIALGALVTGWRWKNRRRT